MIIEMVRHGETAYSIDHRYLGIKDEPLCTRGMEGLVQAKMENTGYPVSRVYVTCLCRTAQTAEILYPGLEQVVVPGLEEMDFGVFEGRSADEMEQDPQYRAWVESGCLDRCPGGEKKEEFDRRVITALLNVLENASLRGEERVILVCHGGTIMAAMEEFALPHKEFYRWSVSCGCGYRIQAERKDGIPELWRFHVLQTLDYRKKE